MQGSPKYVAEIRPEPKFAHRWGVRSVIDGRWLPVVYHSEKEAKEALKVIG